MDNNHLLSCMHIATILHQIMEKYKYGNIQIMLANFSSNYAYLYIITHHLPSFHRSMYNSVHRLYVLPFTFYRYCHYSV
jgi:hypothetical protein